MGNIALDNRIPFKVVALPFCHFALKAKKPASAHYPTEIITLGDHLRKKRLDMKLLQREVGKRIGVDSSTILNWERNRCYPRLYHLPKVIEFLGCCPYDPDWSPGRVLTMARKYRGLSQEAMARRLGVDPGTLAKWERDEKRPLGAHLIRLKRIYSQVE